MLVRSISPTQSQPQLHLQLFVLLEGVVLLFLQPFDPLLQFGQLVFRAGGELLDDLEDAPQAEHHDEGAGFFERAGAQDEVDDEGRDDDEGVECVEGGGEVAWKDTCVRCLYIIYVA
jgi:hypothetical protein